MYENPIVQDNLKILQVYGYGVVDPAVGYLACGDTGAGKMVEPDVLLDVILQEIAYEKRSGRFEDPCNGRPDTGSGRSGTVYYKPFYRKDGLCYCKKSHQGEALR